MVADRHRLAACHNKHCWRAIRGYQHRQPWTTLNPKNIMGFRWFFCYFRLRRTQSEFSLKYTGDRPRQPAYENKLMLWRVSWALAQISCYFACAVSSIDTSVPLRLSSKTRYCTLWRSGWSFCCSIRAFWPRHWDLYNTHGITHWLRLVRSELPLGKSLLLHRCRLRLRWAAFFRSQYPAFCSLLVHLLKVLAREQDTFFLPTPINWLISAVQPTGGP